MFGLRWSLHCNKKEPLRLLAEASGEPARPIGGPVWRFSGKMKTMLTDAPPRRKNLQRFVDSDRLKTVALPTDTRLPRIAGAIETAMKSDSMPAVRTACDEFLRAASEFYKVPRCTVRVLAARPL